MRHLLSAAAQPHADQEQRDAGIDICDARAAVPLPEIDAVLTLAEVYDGLLVRNG